MQPPEPWQVPSQFDIGIQVSNSHLLSPSNSPAALEEKMKYFFEQVAVKRPEMMVLMWRLEQRIETLQEGQRGVDPYSFSRRKGKTVKEKAVLGNKKGGRHNT